MKHFTMKTIFVSGKQKSVQGVFGCSTLTHVLWSNLTRIPRRRYEKKKWKNIYIFFFAVVTFSFIISGQVFLHLANYQIFLFETFNNNKKKKTRLPKIILIRFCWNCNTTMLSIWTRIYLNRHAVCSLRCWRMIFQCLTMFHCSSMAISERRPCDSTLELGANLLVNCYIYIYRYIYIYIVYTVYMYPSLIVCIFFLLLKRFMQDLLFWFCSFMNLLFIPKQ